VGAAGRRDAVQARQRAQPVVVRLGVKPARQQQRAGKGRGARSWRQKPRSKLALCATRAQPRVNSATSCITWAAGGAVASMRLLMPVSCSMNGGTQAPLFIRLA
jgi:hypothetical protein